MNAYTEIWEHKVLYKYQALLLPVYNGKKAVLKENQQWIQSWGIFKN